jgi:hypothetical protein
MIVPQVGDGPAKGSVRPGCNICGVQPYWTSTDLERKLSDFTYYYNRERTHRALGGKPPVPSAEAVANIHSVTWQSHCRGLYQLPFAA